MVVSSNTCPKCVRNSGPGSIQRMADTGSKEECALHSLVLQLLHLTATTLDALIFRHVFKIRVHFYLSPYEAWSPIELESLD